LKKILHSTMKENNYSLILRAIFHNRSIERVNLVKETLLSASTITRCVEQLAKNNVVMETNPSHYGKIGRKALNHPTTYRGGGFRKKFGQTTLILSGWSKQPLACRTLKSTRLLLRSMFSAPLQSAFIIVP